MSSFAGKIMPLIALAVSMVFAASCGQKAPETFTSPDGSIAVTVSAKGKENKNTLVYGVTYKGRTVIDPSKLGLILKGDDVISEGVKMIGQATTTTIDETYDTPFSKAAKARNNCTETTLTFQDTKKRVFEVIFRVFNDGVAFRYHFPEQEGLTNVDIAGEKSHFDFAADHDYWGLHLNKYTTSYETDYTNAKLSNITPQSIVACPILVKVADDLWTAVTEADLDNYAGMYVKGCPVLATRLVTDLAPHPDSSGVAVHAKVPFSTPWRVLMIADNPGRLVESNIVMNLNPPVAIDTSWIKPGKTAWDWWSGQVVKGERFKGTMDNRTMKHYIDFAAETGLEYMLVDAGWYGDHAKGEEDITKMIPDIDIPELVQYANAKNVDIIIWINWKGVDRQMDAAFPLYESWGVKGVKVDYMDRDDQEMVNFYSRVVKKAAEHHLLVDFHGAYKPTGLRRTYPNLITREGVMGLEYCKWSDRITPDHDCTLPFTRMLAGPMDYTPGGFSNTVKGQFKSQNIEPMTQGTRCHQLGLYVVFESPLQMLVDYPGNYRGQDGYEFLKKVPSVWDETKVIDGAPGDYIVMARKKGDEWYLGSLTDWTPRDLTVTLSFLGQGDYVAECYADSADADTNAESVAITKTIVGAGTSFKLKMAPGGGAAVRFYPAPAGTDLPKYE